MGPIEQADIWLFRLLNGHQACPAADDLMLFLTNAGLSLHLLFLAATFMIVRRGKDGLFILILAAIAVGIADFAASGIMKPLFHRVRPCFALEGVRLLVAQSHSWSFASSHAANAAAVATTVWIFFRGGAPVDRAYVLLMAAYGLLVAFSRIYVGVHYPGDVLGGIAIGIASASLVYTVAAWTVKRFVHGAAMRNTGSWP
ncbi:MAG: phosphatase PAP2 family protein [Chlorobiaceae bacterium]|nr:phosphatase PAP2 family protein [Chlorobiaceae bacterium]